MGDCSPLRLAENGESSPPSQSSGASRTDRLIRNDYASSLRPQSHQIYHTRNIRQECTGNHHTPGASMTRRERNRSPSECESTKSAQLRYDTKNVIEVFIPVSICMLIVVGTMKATDSYKYSSQTIVWYAHVMFTDQTVDTGTRVWQSFANALIMLMVVVIMTTALILLYKFRCYKIIHGWLILSSLILLFLFEMMYIAEILKVYNIPMDVYTLMIFIWNFGVVGMICIHWKGPLLLQQCYLVLISALLALIFIRSLPDWTTWTVLGILSIWDLVAVLCPQGPLRILVETAQERNEAIFPALIYSSTMLWEVVTTVISPSVMTADDPSSSRRVESNQENVSRRDLSSSNSKKRRQNASGLQNKARQHPVEIHYEGEQQPPEVDIIQPSLSGTSENWTQPSRRTHRTHRINFNSKRQRDTQIEAGSSEGTSSGTQAPISAAVEIGANGESTEVVHVEEERGVKLGLGDFIFFSVLVGKASSYGDWTITISCYVAILVGLCLTLSLLAVFRKALPALPISIAFGLCSFFMSYMFAMPLAEELATNQVFI